MTKPRLLIINRSFWPDTEATGQLLTQLCEDLSAEFAITVICGQPNHVAGQGGRPQRSPGREEYRGIQIRRAPHTRFPKRSMLGRLLNLVTFSFTSAWLGLFASRPDIVIVETDPFFLPLVGRCLQLRFGCRLVTYLQDLYPDIAVAVGKAREGWVTGLLRRALFGVYRRADRVVVLSRDMWRRCVRNGVPEERLEILPNWADTEAIRPLKSNNAFRAECGYTPDQFVVMHSGNLGMAHDLDPLLTAAEQLRDRPEIQFAFVGDGVKKGALEAAVRDRGLTNVRFFPYQPRERLAESLSAADVHVVSVLPSVVECMMPSKLYGVLASGTAVLALAPPGCELVELVNQHELGLSASADDPKGLASAIRQLADDRSRVSAYGANARRIAEAEFTQAKQTQRFATLLQTVLQPGAEATWLSKDVR